MIKVTVRSPKAESVSAKGQGARAQASEGSYAGPYEVTPTLPGLELATKRKLMLDDVSVLPIPVSKVSNDKNGYTVTIG